MSKVTFLSIQLVSQPYVKNIGTCLLTNIWKSFEKAQECEARLFLFSSQIDTNITLRITRGSV